MKRCPQCNKVFEDNKVFCTHDGTALIGDSLSLPSDFSPEDNDDEQETILRYKPKDFDISSKKIPKPQPNTPQQQPQINHYARQHRENNPSQNQSKANGGCLKYSIILLTGLLIGGAMVLAAIGIGYYYLNSSVSNTENTENEKPIEKNKSNESVIDSSENSKKTHSERNPNADVSKLNGRVIKRTAVLRSSPNSRAKRLARLPKKDRIEIIRRKSPTSKWYEIECEHGAKGWVNGYSIEFKQNF